MRCRWVLFALAVLAAGWSAAPAQQPPLPKEGPWVIPMTVSPTSETRPALKYRLLPELRDVLPGNQVQAFYKSFFEQNYLFHDKESTDRQKKWMEAPLKDLAGEKDLVNYGRVAVEQARYASRLDTVDWQILNQIRADGVLVLLPDIQQMRMLATVLKVRVRGEIARGEFDNAAQTLQILFALGRTFNDHPTLIGHLVGIAITMIALGEVEEFIQQPGAPNLFWPLVDLPSPFIDLRKGREGERLFLPKEFDTLRKAVPVPEADLDALVKKLDPWLDLSEARGHLKPNVWYPRQAVDKAAVAAATKRLADAGHAPAALAKLSPLQIVLMDDRARYEADLDDFVKWTNLPFWQIPADFGTKETDRGPFGELLPAWQKVMLARTRLQQQVALLATAEAIRAHAAANAGRLPNSLAEIKLPVPADAYTGKPFVYEAKGGKAVVRGNPPAEVAGNPANNKQYEITLRK